LPLYLMMLIHIIIEVQLFELIDKGIDGKIKNLA